MTTETSNELDAQVERIIRLAKQIEAACSGLRQQITADIAEIKSNPVWKRWEDAAHDRSADDRGSD